MKPYLKRAHHNFAFSDTKFLPIVLAIFYGFIAIVRQKDYGLFIALTSEDSWFENFSSFLFLLSWLILTHHCFINRKKLNTYIGFFIGFVFFTAAMEEISWGQRLFDLQTPFWLQKLNSKNEINIHNIDTVYANSLFYFLSFLFFVLLPHLHNISMLIDKKYPAISLFTGGKFTLFSGILIFSLQHYYWEIYVVKISSLITFCIVLYYVIHSDFSHSMIFYSIVFTATFIMCLVESEPRINHNFHRVSEVCEFSIALTALIYSLEIRKRHS